MPFGNHLSTDENINLTLQHGGHDLLMCPFARGRIPIHTGNSSAGEEFAQFLFELFRSGPRCRDIQALTLTAGSGT